MCLTPIQLKKETVKQKIADKYHMQQVPCGKCLECKKRRVNSWFVRLKNQLEDCENAYMVTLTYDDEHLPYSENGLMTLNYRDFQLFMKRYRKANENSKVRYYCVGEYGANSFRPHYHAIMYNIDCVSLMANWTFGFVHFVNVTDATLYYTLKYVTKSTFKMVDEDDDRVPEKALISKGLGLNFLTDNIIKYYHDDPFRGVTLLGNKKLSLPRYYRDKIFDESQKKLRNKLLDKHAEKAFYQRTDKLFPQRVEKMYQNEQKKLKKTD